MNYWNNIFSKGLIWGSEPADSAIDAAEYFQQNSVNNILIPGIGYGRNVKPFVDKNISVTGIEISENAIITAKSCYDINIHHGSVLDLPFDNSKYDGIYCYSLLHLFNRTERKRILSLLFDQLSTDGIMILVVVSTKSQLFGEGRLISSNRFKLSNGLKVYFYNEESIENEFSRFGLVSYEAFDEPVKFLPDEKPINCFRVICKKIIHN